MELIGVLLIAFGAVLRTHARRVRAAMRLTTGVVEDVRPCLPDDDGRRFHPVVKFRDIDGKPGVCTAARSDRKDAWTIGQKVTVVIDVDNARPARLDTQLPSAIISTPAIALGCALTVLGLARTIWRLMAG